MDINTITEPIDSVANKKNSLLSHTKKKNERTSELPIPSDVYLAMDGAPYDTPYKALEDAFDNCLTGLSDDRLTSDEPRKIIVDFFCDDSSIPHYIRLSDNGIGMDEDTKKYKLFVTKTVSALEKAAKGGTGRWGLGFKQFTNFLGTAGPVITREVGLPDDVGGLQSSVVYEEGKLPKVTTSDISKERFKQEVHGFEHGTRIDIENIKKEKWTSSWWNPKGLTWFKSTQIRYNRLLRDGKLVIVFNKHTGKGVETKVLSSGEFILDNGLTDETAYTDYVNSTRNNWEVKGVDLDVDKLGISVKMNMGKHLGAIWKKEWDTIGSIDLIAGSASKASNPGVYFYQNNVLLATFKYKGSDRDGGLSHLNNLFVEIDIPNDIIVPTNSTKSDIDDAWKKEVAKQIKIEAEKKWIPQDVKESTYHKAFQEKVLNEMDGMGIRHKMFEGVSHTELEETLYHEFAKGSSRPDFKWETNDKLKAIIEFKDEQANDNATKQMAKYAMDTQFEADYYYLVAPSFNDGVVNTFNTWNKYYPNTKFIMISFDEIVLKID